MLKIGDIELKNNIVLGPMAGLTDRPFRMICEKFNPGFVATEMCSSKALLYNDEKTKLLLNTKGEKGPIVAQIFGSDEEAISFAVKYITKNKIADIVDINMGCPAPKVVKNGDGSKLLLNPSKVYSITKSAVDVTNIPITVKIRKGFDNDNINAVEVAKQIEKAGAKALTVHGRTRSEFYSGNVDLDIIKKVKNEISIPVIGNGDVRNANDARRMFEKTNCDGIMISRGALGKPWIFREITQELNNEKCESITNEEKLKIILEHIDLEVEEKGEYIGIREMRKHLCYYIKGEKNASEVRQKIIQLESVNEVKQELIKCYS